MLAVILLLCGANYIWAQSAINDIPEKVDAADATITEMGHATITMKREVVTDPLTHLTDTIVTIENIEWNTEAGTAKKRMAQRNAANGSDFEYMDQNWAQDMQWFKFNYPSINADGEEVVLSSMACMPDGDNEIHNVNNIIVGCHITITSDKECPTSYDGTFSAALSDVRFIMSFAGSGINPFSHDTSQPHVNLVILPDYEGYGVTKTNAHPYLYQELTARQVVDAVRYGKALYETSSAVNSIRHPFRSGWRTITLGYSQGGSVALATQRFIEQNGLTDELHLAGSICADGPYDLMSTLMYYVANDSEGKPMSMPVVLPLILKGMCDSNPYMKNHQVSDYLSERFLETGIIDWITSKNMSTDDITDEWKNLYRNGKNGDSNYFREVLTSDGKAYLNKILTEEGYNYFKSLYDTNKNTYTSATGIPLPTHRGLMEDLHFALESNNVTMGWQPQHAIFLYHSYNDTVVPEKNRERACNTIGDWVIRVKGSGNDHVNEGTSFFFSNSEKADRCVEILAGSNIHQTVSDVTSMKSGFSYLDQ